MVMCEGGADRGDPLFIGRDRTRRNRITMALQQPLSPSGAVIDHTRVRADVE